MPDACEFLEYRDGTAAVDADSDDTGGADSDDDSEAEFDHERPYCTAVDAFVQPMRADVCAKRYGLDPESDCELYREAKGLGSITGFEGEATSDDDAATDEVDS